MARMQFLYLLTIDTWWKTWYFDLPPSTTELVISDTKESHVGLTKSGAGKVRARD